MARVSLCFFILVHNSYEKIDMFQKREVPLVLPKNNFLIQGHGRGKEMIPCIECWELINGFCQIHEIVNNVIRIFFLITFGDIFDIILKCIRNNHSYIIITYQTSIKFTLMFKDIFGLSLAFIIAFLKLISIVKKFIFLGLWHPLI